MAVLKLREAVSSVTFFMVLFKRTVKVLVSGVEVSLTGVLYISLSDRFQIFYKNLNTPMMPLVFQGFETSKGPKNIS